MIRRIKLYIFIWLLFNSHIHADNIFNFYKAISSCNNSIGAFTQEEANIEFKNYKIDFAKYSLLEQNANNDSINFFRNCIEKELSTKIIDISLYKSQNDWPFDEVFYINNKYITLFMDGACFIFFNSNTNKEVTNILQSKNTPIKTEKGKSFFSKLLEWFGFSKLNHNMSFMYS